MSDARFAKLKKLAVPLASVEAGAAILAEAALSTEEGRKQVGLRLGLQIQAHQELKSKTVVQILVPSYKTAHPRMRQMAGAMIRHAKAFCEVQTPDQIGSSVVHWARNQLIAPLYQNKVMFTHVLFLDDDIAPPEDALVRLLRHEKDIVAAACTRRVDPPVPNFRMFDEKTGDYRQVVEWPMGQLIEFGGAGTGMMLITRGALDKIAEAYITCAYEREFLGSSDDKVALLTEGRRKYFEETGDASWFRFLPHPEGRGEYGEDISFCRMARLCNIPVYVDTAVQPEHMGDYGYSIKDFLYFQQSEIDKGKAEGTYIVEQDDFVRIEDDSRLAVGA